MFLADYHIHSSCSFDAKNTMADMACAAAKLGMNEVCFTDHCDVGSKDTLQVGNPDFSLPKKQVHQFIETMEKAPDGLFVGLGLELGAPNHDPARAKRIYAMPEYDFVLGSLHQLRGEQDFYYIKYTGEEQIYDLYGRYLEELIEIAALPCYDVIAHIGYSLRYSSLQGYNAAITMDRYGDQIDTLLRTVIDAGKGIELNAGDLTGARGMAFPACFPSPEILRRYKELGGTVITVGSDAHTVAHAGIGVAEGFELLQTCGFRYVTTFRRHKPEFIRI